MFVWFFKELDSCIGCDKGQYLFNNVCVNCPSHSSSAYASSDISDCICDSGYTAGPDNSCVACGEGYYKNISGNHECTACPDFATSVAGSTSIFNCNCHEGYKQTAHHECGLICSKGFEHHEANVACHPCQNNHYKSSEGDHACHLCPANSFHGKYNSTTIEDCLCSSGYVRHELWPDVAQCVPCSNGTFNSAPGSEVCFDCFSEVEGNNGVSHEPDAWTYTARHWSTPAYLNDNNQIWCHSDPSYVTVDLGSFQVNYGLHVRGNKERGWTNIAKRWAFYYWYAPSDDLLPSNADMENANFHNAVWNSADPVSDFENAACEITGCWKRLTTAQSAGFITIDPAETAWPTYMDSQFGEDCDSNGQCFSYKIKFSEHSFIAFDTVRTRYWRVWIQKGTYNNQKCLTFGAILGVCEKSTAANLQRCESMCNFVAGHRITETGTLEKCGFNQYNDGSGKECLTCSEGSGHYNVGVESEADCECHAGYYRPFIGMGSCQKCPVNTYKDAAGDNACIACPENALAPTASTSQDSCLCKPGFEFRDGSCLKCPAGYYKPDVGNSACIQCGANTISFAENTVCKCKRGFSASFDNLDCALCPSGKYQDQFGAHPCKTCSVNSTSEAGSISVNNCTCLPGFIAQDDNSCVLACAPGYHYIEATMECKSCASGFFSPHGIACEQCALPMTRSTPGATSNAACFCGEGHIGLRYTSYVIIKELGAAKHTQLHEGSGNLQPAWRAKQTSLLKNLALRNLSPRDDVFVYAHSHGESLLMFSCDMTVCASPEMDISLDGLSAEIEIIAPESVAWSITSFVGREVIAISRWKCIEGFCELLTVSKEDNQILFSAQDSPSLWNDIEKHCLGVCSPDSLVFIEPTPSGRDVCQACGPGLICD